MSKPKPLEMELERLAGKTPRTTGPRPVAGEGAWFGTGSKIENKEEIRRNQLEISSN
jgi:hypothetical protein